MRTLACSLEFTDCLLLVRVAEPVKFAGESKGSVATHGHMPFRITFPKGQVPDQSYGYAWPLGPFFALGHLAHMPPWMVQRLWWALLLCLAFFGMLRLLERLMLGSELTRLVAALVFVLTPRMTTLVGVVSVEVWPMALAPWVLLPLVRGSQKGSVRRAAATSALVVGCCGGVNAVAVAAVLPLGVIWLLTREPGPRRRECEQRAQP